MKKNRYEILKKHINTTKLVSLTSQNWYDENGKLVPWTSGSIYIGPNTGDIVFNLTGGTVTTGYYKWNTPITGRWNLIEPAPTKLSTETDTEYLNKVSAKNFDSFFLPIFLESTVDEMGVMVGFDGNIQQVEQLCNFSYTQTGYTIQIYNTVNPDAFRGILEQTFTIKWGDGNTSGLTVNSGIVGTNFPTIVHTYPSTTTGYTISITLDAPWLKQKINKQISVPKNLTQDLIGTYTYTGTNLPYYNTEPIEYYLQSGRTQDYLNDLEYNPPTGYTNNVYNNVFGNYTGFTYLGIGGSRLEEKRRYGATTYFDTTIDTTTFEDGSILSYTGYSFTYTYTGLTSNVNDDVVTTLTYRDYEDGTTLITGNTTGFTKEEIRADEIIRDMITRNEHFLGFVDDPTVYSDIFVERGKQGVLEKTLRLSEIDNTGELSIYGNGYFNIRKQ